MTTTENNPSTTLGYADLIAELEKNIAEFGDGEYLAIWRKLEGVDTLVDYLPEGVRNEDMAKFWEGRVVPMKASEILEQLREQATWV